MQRHAISGPAVSVGSAQYPVTLDDGQVRVHLPFTVDPQALSALLQREGFPLAHQPDTTDTQGWGHDFEGDGYYPYYVYPDPDAPGQYVFAFNPEPEDVVDLGTGRGETVDLGQRSLAKVERWVPVLERLQPPGVRP
ncbi:MAG TPA: hypothetical protein VK464_19495 [Symbiobacteriaceae bacterium]|nr:hypothetical protein [Symbiobacteriaceae bacterium]